jgi:hypothetical protein
MAVNIKGSHNSYFSDETLIGIMPTLTNTLITIFEDCSKLDYLQTLANFRHSGASC